MNSNRDGLLTLQNPFFLDYRRLKHTFGVNILVTPTLMTFAQLQNFFTYTALERNWEYYFWAHMDSPVVSDEGYEEEGKYKSLYVRAIDDMRATMDPAYGKSAMRWYSYDRLELARTQAIVDVGGWDTLIPYYMTDCDMHERLWMKGFKTEVAKVGNIYDVFSSVDDLEIFYRRTPQATNFTDSGGRNSTVYYTLLAKLEEMQKAKDSSIVRRNTWQWRQHGGQGEPFYRNSDGFGEGIRMTMEFGRKVFAAKWGRRKCNLREAGLTDNDAWRVKANWERRSIARMFHTFFGG
ncbi:MAG: hypothetical protein LQ351_003047 [Letrouitia transgressa]|nr:MAG: hypothetical protein LQ351_003047 [Letrouitia transgressa]